MTDRVEPALTPEEFQCAVCRGVFEKGWTEEEALAERDALWGPEVEAGDAFSQVCDDCWKKLPCSRWAK